MEALGQARVKRRLAAIWRPTPFSSGLAPRGPNPRERQKWGRGSCSILTMTAE